MDELHVLPKTPTGLAASCAQRCGTKYGMTTPLEQIVISSINLRPATKKAYLRAVGDFIQFAGRNPARWTGTAAEAWRNDLAKRLDRSSVRNYLFALRMVSRRWAEQNGNNPAYNFATYAEVPVRKKDPTATVLTIVDARRLVATCDGNTLSDIRDRAMLVLGFRTGLRRSSICRDTASDMPGLQFAGIDTKTHQLEVRLKGGHEYTLPPVDSETWAALAEWLAVCKRFNIREGGIFRRLHARLSQGPTPTFGEALTAAGLYDTLRKRAQSIDVPFSPHAMRHSFIAWCREAKLETHLIAAYTGHALEGGSIGSYGDPRAEAARVMPTENIPWLVRK